MKIKRIIKRDLKRGVSHQIDKEEGLVILIKIVEKLSVHLFTQRLTSNLQLINLIFSKVSNLCLTSNKFLLPNNIILVQQSSIMFKLLILYKCTCKISRSKFINNLYSHLVVEILEVCLCQCMVCICINLQLDLITLFNNSSK